MRPIRLLILLGVLAGTALLAAGAGSPSTAPFPATIALPDGFRPEGIAIHGARFFVGSIPTGAIYSGSLRTGQGSILVPGGTGRAATGVAADGRGRLFVAGAASGHGYVYDARTGALVHDYTLTSLTSFINDVVATNRAVFFTDSTNKVLYRLALGPGGSLPAASTPVPLSGEIVYGAGLNLNGIEASPSGKTLVAVQTNTGFLFRVDPATGATDRIELAGGEALTNGDGLLLDGRSLYVVRNRNNEIVVVRLAPGLGSGAVRSTITSGAFDVPTTIDEHGARIYAVNARFGVASPDLASYSIVQVPKR